MFVATNRILGAYKRNGFFSATVTGARGIGKSSYALKVLQDVYTALGYDNETAWRMALDRCLYRIVDVVDFLEKSSNQKEHEVAFIWDDASVFAAGARWLTHHREMILLQAIMDTVRGSVSAMILTCPDLLKLARFLRRYDDYLIKIGYSPRGGMYREAKGYVRRILPSQQIRVYRNYLDSYSCYLPNWVYDEYCLKRDDYNRENTRYLKELLEKVK